MRPSPQTPIVLAGREITLELPVTVVAGTPFEVTWEAIEADLDYVTIVAADADEGSYESYFYTADGPTGTLVAPITEGVYEIRFVSGLDAATMAASEIAVTPLEITIDAPATVTAGADFEVSWTWPQRAGRLSDDRRSGGSRQRLPQLRLYHRGLTLDPRSSSRSRGLRDPLPVGSGSRRLLLSSDQSRVATGVPAARSRPTR